MTASLIVVPFSRQHLPLVQNFACGDEDHERELAEWIRTDSVLTIDRGGKVWLFVTPDKILVGFGSVVTTRWNYPDPASKRETLALIPAVAIRKQFWGQPEGPTGNRYSSLILDHLILEAALLPISVPILGLYVHPANLRAVKVYERAGFLPFTQRYTDRETGIAYTSMIRPIVLANPS